MIRDAEMTMLLNRGLLPVEKSRLEGWDAEVTNVLWAAGITKRCGWTGHGQGSERMLKLIEYAENERTLMQLLASDIISLSREELIGKLKIALAV
jgi:hypothetical protein